MGRLVYIMGKSSTGKDTIYKRLLKDTTLELKQIVPYTTRPIREGEQNGVEYFFTTDAQCDAFMEAGKIIELRAYDTFHGVWKYYTVEDEQFDLSKGNRIMIGTLQSYIQILERVGEENVIPILVKVEDGERLMRALRREMQQKNPKYQELCRRFLADEEDFSLENEQKAGIKKAFYNQDLETCICEIIDYLKEKL